MENIITNDFNNLNFLKDLSIIPILYYIDIDIINIIFNRYVSPYKKEITISELLLEI